MFLLVFLVTAGTTAQPAQISLIVPQVGNRLDFYTAAVERFHQEHPDIAVEIVPHQWTGSPDYAAKLAVMAAGDALPDLILLPSSVLRNLAGEGIIKALDPLLEKDAEGVALSDFVPPALVAGQLGGKTYALPVGLDLVWITYGVDAVAESGVASLGSLFEAGDWDFDTFDQVASKLTVHGDDGNVRRYGLLISRDLSVNYPWIVGMGGEVFDRATGRVVIDRPGAVAGLEYVANLVLGRGSTVVGGILRRATNGEFAMTVWWSSVPHDLRGANYPFAIDQVPMPAGPVSAATNAMGTDSMGMSATTRNEAAAWTFMKWYSLNLAHLPGYSQLVGQTPPRLSQLNTWIQSREDDGLEGARYLREVANLLNPLPPLPSSVEAAINAEFNKLFRGEIDPAAAAVQAATAANAELDRLFGGGEQ